MKKTTWKVSVVVPNFNGLGLLKKNLPVLLEEKNRAENKISEIIVVDDGSTDDSVKYIKSNFPKVKIIKHTKNRGFSAAVNTGARSTIGNLIALINNDVRPHRLFLKKALDHFDDEKMFAVSLNEGEFGWAKARFEKGFVIHSAGKLSSKPHMTFWVSGGSGVFRRDLWMRLKGMDEELYSPYYWEDVDIGYRALKRGWKLIWEPGARVDHEHESTTRKISKKHRLRIQERNQLIFIWKNITSKNMFRKHIAAIVAHVIRHPGYIRIVILAFRKLKIILKARKKESQEARVSDESIFAMYRNI